MNSFTRLLPAVCILIATQVFAGPAPEEQSTPASQESSSAAAPAKDSSTASTTSSTTPPSTAAAQPGASVKVGKNVLIDKNLTDSQVKELLSQGFRPEARGDQIVYCRREAPVGSRFEEKICRTGEQIALQRSDSKEMAEYLQRTTTIPSGK